MNGIAGLTKLAGGIAGLINEIVVKQVLEEASKNINANTIMSDEDRLAAEASSREDKLTQAKNVFKAYGPDGDGGKILSSLVKQIENSISNGVGWVTGGDTGRDALLQPSEVKKSIREYAAQKYGQKITTDNLEIVVNANGQTLDEFYKEWDEATGYTKETRKIKQASYRKKEERTRIEKKDQDEVKKELDVKEAKSSKEQGTPSTIGTVGEDQRESLKQKIIDRISTVKNENTVQTLTALLGGMRTDSEQYFDMRRDQVRKMRAVLSEELKLYDNHIHALTQIIAKEPKGSQKAKDAQKELDKTKAERTKRAASIELDILQENWNLQQELFQKRLGRVQKQVQRTEQTSQNKELIAGISMDRESREYLNQMLSITKGKVSGLRRELESMRAIYANGDMSEEKAQAIRNLENSIASENLKVKELNISKIGTYRQGLQDKASERENNYLREKLKRGGADDETPAMRMLRIRMAKQESEDIDNTIKQLKADLSGKGVEEQKKVQQEIRELTKQQLQAQLNILQEMKTTAGTFNLPDNVQAMSYYEHVTRNQTHSTYSIGNGDVNVNITLPNITNGMTTAHMAQLGAAFGSGLASGRNGGLRNQMLMNTVGYRRRY